MSKSVPGNWVAMDWPGLTRISLRTSEKCPSQTQTPPVNPSERSRCNQVIPRIGFDVHLVFLDPWFTRVSDFLKTGAVPCRKMLISDIILVDGSYHIHLGKWWKIHLTCHFFYGSVFVGTGQKQSSVRMMRLDMRWTSMPWHIKKWGKRWVLKGSIKLLFLSLLRTSHHLTSILRFKWQPGFGYHGCLIFASSNSAC